MSASALWGAGVCCSCKGNGFPAPTGGAAGLCELWQADEADCVLRPRTAAKTPFRVLSHFKQVSTYRQLKQAAARKSPSGCHRHPVSAYKATDQQ